MEVSALAWMIDFDDQEELGYTMGGESIMSRTQEIIWIFLITPRSSDKN